MKKDRVVIAVISTVIFSSILFGMCMAYKIYKSPMYVENIDEMVDLLIKDSDDEYLRMHRLSIFYDLSRSCKMIDRKTKEVRKFTKDEMKEIYESIGGKEAVLNYLMNIENEEERRNMITFAREQLKIITDNELLELWYKIWKIKKLYLKY